MRIKFRGKEFEIDVRKSSGVRGLMFYRRESASALIFNFQSSLHSFFVFFDFLVLWLDGEGNVLDYLIVKPWTFFVDSSVKYSQIVEIPVNRRYFEVVKFIVGERFKKK